MPTLDDSLPYAAAAITMLAGIFGFFWARSGERNKISGIGWTALVFLVAGGIVTVVQTHLKSRSAARASAEAERLSDELRRTQYRQFAVLTTLMGGIRMGRPVESGSFYFDVGTRDFAPIQFPGFVGPFPALPQNGVGLLTLDIPALFNNEYRLRPQGAGRLGIFSQDAGLPDFSIAATDAGVDFERLGPPPEDEQASASGSWVTDAIDQDYSYHLEIAPASPDGSGQSTGAVIAALAQAESFGRLLFRIPGLDEAGRRRIIASYARIRPFIVLALPLRPDPDDSGQGCVTRIRVPVEIVPMAPDARGANPDDLLFALKPGLRGFDTEICGWTP